MNTVKLGIAIDEEAAKSLRRDEMTFLPIDRMNYNYSKVFNDKDRIEEELLYGESIGWVYNEILYKIRQVCNVSNAKIYAEDLNSNLESLLRELRVGGVDERAENIDYTTINDHSVFVRDEPNVSTVNSGTSAVNNRGIFGFRSDDEFGTPAANNSGEFAHNSNGSMSENSDDDSMSENSDFESGQTLGKRYGYYFDEEETSERGNGWSFQGGGIMLHDLLDMPFYTFFSLLSALGVDRKSVV